MGRVMYARNRVSGGNLTRSRQMRSSAARWRQAHAVTRSGAARQYAPYAVSALTRQPPYVLAVRLATGGRRLWQGTPVASAMRSGAPQHIARILVEFSANTALCERRYRVHARVSASGAPRRGGKRGRCRSSAMQCPSPGLFAPFYQRVPLSVAVRHRHAICCRRAVATCV